MLKYIVIAAIVVIALYLLVKSRKGSASEEVIAPAAAEAPVQAAAPSRPAAPGSAGEIKLYNVPPKQAAMIMAIVADTLKTPLNELRFKSIKLVDDPEN